jgi:hypothetical protein
MSTIERIFAQRWDEAHNPDDDPLTTVVDEAVHRAYLGDVNSPAWRVGAVSGWADAAAERIRTALLDDLARHVAEELEQVSDTVLDAGAAAALRADVVLANTR